MITSKTDSVIQHTSKGLAHKDDYYETPDWLFNDIVKKTKLRFDLDLCANDANTKCMAYVDEEMDVLRRDGRDGYDHWKYHDVNDAIWCNPPRSKNGKFVNLVYDVIWSKYNINTVMLLCWNDLGNKYGKKLLPHIINGDFKVVGNYGKIKFNKNGIESKFVSRLTYFALWFKSKPLNNPLP